MIRGATMEPTTRQLDTLAAWWKAGGSNIGAASLLGVQPQVVRNTLLAFRRQERAQTNLNLALRFQTQIERRHILRKRAA